jgi:hypothetical protein
MLSVWHACSEQQLGRRWPTTPAEERGTSGRRRVGIRPAPELLAAGAATVVDDVCSLTAMVMRRRIAGR